MPFKDGIYFANYPASLKQGLIGWWTFDDGGAKDYSGNNNHGTLAGSVKPSPAGGQIPGTALSFDGANSHVDTLLNPSGLTAFSISAWVYHNSVAGGQRLIANSHTDADNNGFQLIVGSSLTFNVGNGTTFAQVGHGSFVNNQKYHVAATLDIANNLMAIYMDGVLGINGTTISGTLSAGLNNISFGFNPTYAGDFFNGIGDDFRMWKRLLTVSEIVALSSLGRRRFPRPYLVGVASAPSFVPAWARNSNIPVLGTGTY